jgi:glycosyltransferase EpsD
MNEVKLQKKALFVSHRANFQKFNQPLMKMLREMGWTVHYASDNAEKIIDADKSFKISFSRHPWSLWSHFISFWQMRKLLKREMYDLIHTHTATASVITRLANRQKKSPNHRPLIYTPHHFQFQKGGSLMDWIWYPIEKFLADNYTDMLVAISDGDYKITKKWKVKVSQISGVGVDTTKFRPSLTFAERAKFRKNVFGFTADDFVIGYVAEMINRKNHIELLKALRRSVAQHPNVRLVLVGDGKNMLKIQKTITRYHLQNNVKIITKKLPKIEQLYESLDLEISPSKREGLGMHLLEALAVGTPILASNIEGHNKFAGENELYILDKKGKNLAFAIDFLYNLWYNRGISGNKLPRSSLMPRKFNLENSIKEMRKIYAKIIKI